MFCASLIPSVAVVLFKWGCFVTTLSLYRAQRQRVRSLGILAHPGDSFDLDAVAAVPSEATCRGDFHNAYFEVRVSGTSLAGLVGRVIISVPRSGANTTAGDRNARRSDRSNWFDGRRGRGPSFGRVTTPTSRPINEDVKTTAARFQVHRRKRPLLEGPG